MIHFSRALLTSSLLIAVSGAPLLASADVVLYNNGPNNGTIAGVPISNGDQVQDSFTLGSASTLDGIAFANWLPIGDSASSVDWAIVTTAETQTLACLTCSGTATLSSGISVSHGLYDVVGQTFSLPGISLDAGTYWLELQNEIVTNGDMGGWDENGGSSQAWSSLLGTVPSESFTIVGTSAATPEPGSLALLGSGLAFVAADIRRRRRSKG